MTAERCPYYRLDEHGEPVPCHDILEWGRSKDLSHRGLGNTTVGDANVSTVFLGVDHNWAPDGKPILWETMIFGGKYDELCLRYYSRAEAVAGHERVVAALKEGLEP